MGKVTCFLLSGYDLWFNSDDHRPPHFHAERHGEWEVRVYFLNARKQMFELKWKRSKPPSKGDLKLLAELTEASRDKLMAEWEAKVNVKAPGATP